MFSHVYPNTNLIRPWDDVPHTHLHHNLDTGLGLERLAKLPPSHREIEQTVITLVSPRLMEQLQDITPSVSQINLYLSPHVWEEAYRYWKAELESCSTSDQPNLTPVFDISLVKRVRLRQESFNDWQLSFKGPKAAFCREGSRILSREEEAERQGDPLVYHMRLESPAIQLAQSAAIALMRHGVSGVLKKDRCKVNSGGVSVSFDFLTGRCAAPVEIEARFGGRLAIVDIEFRQEADEAGCFVEPTSVFKLKAQSIQTSAEYRGGHKLKAVLSAYQLASLGFPRQEQEAIFEFLDHKSARITQETLQALFTEKAFVTN